MTRILIVEDLAETREWLREIAREAFQPPHEIDETATMRTALVAISQHSYDIALVDLGLPDGTGMEVLHRLRMLHPDALSVVTTVMGDDAHIVAALAAGANGYLLKEQPAQLLVRQLSQLSDGLPALSPSVARRIMQHFQRTGPVTAPDEHLTEREKEVLALIARGMRNADVAAQLAIAATTVAHHIKAIYRKLGINSRAEASWHASQYGLVPGTADREP